jgi:hypothetical protein
MAEKTRAELKVYFETGDKPTEAQFIDLFDSIPTFKDNVPPERIISKRILFSDINGGVSPQVSIDIALVSLAIDEFISSVFIEGVVDFVDSGPNADLLCLIYDNTNGFSVLNPPFALQTNPDTVSGVLTAFNSSTYPFPFSNYLIHVGARDIVLRFTASDLTLLTAGEFILRVGISTFVAP